MQNKALDALKILGIDAIANANSGHPGIVLGAAPMLYALFTKHINVYPKESHWINRDRFILSAGHGSALLYSMLHFSGYKISLEDMKKFRTFGNTPGHPEYGHTDGVETTSGPLGQGIANAVGMAITEKKLSHTFNKADINLIDHYTYVLCGDGDLQEGVALEALSLAGHLKLNKLIILFDSNDIQLDGPVKSTYSEDHKNKFKAMGFQYIKVEDGMNHEAVSKALLKAKKSEDMPVFIEIKTIIGSGTDVEGSSNAHGKPLTASQITALKNDMKWDQKPFEFSKDIYDLYKKKVYNRGKKAFKSWLNGYQQYKEKYPEDINEFENFFKDIKSEDLSELYQLPFKKGEATRISSGKVIDFITNKFHNIIGGSADLSSSTKAKGANGDFSNDNLAGRNINFGVREHAMGAISNGILLHGGLRVFTGAFFVFSDYMKPSIRLSALMQIPNIFVMTHDSVAVGEDGPTHQPIEQLVGLRAIPNLNVLRPANEIETAASYEIALTSKKTPSLIVLSRQDLLETSSKKEDVLKGAYIISKEQNRLDGILLATGSEVGIACEAQKKLFQDGVDVRVVSMLSQFQFFKQLEEYQKQIIPNNTKILAIEAGHPMSWYKFTPHVIGIDTFGASAEGSQVMEYFLMTSEHIRKTFLNL